MEKGNKIRLVVVQWGGLHNNGEGGVSAVVCGTITNTKVTLVVLAVVWDCIVTIPRIVILESALILSTVESVFFFSFFFTTCCPGRLVGSVVPSPFLVCAVIQLCQLSPSSPPSLFSLSSCGSCHHSRTTNSYFTKPNIKVFASVQ